MMLLVNHAIIANFKHYCKNIKNLSSAAMIICGMISFVYFLHWILLMSDIEVLRFTYPYFSPLANFLFPDANITDATIQTSFLLIKAIIPVFAIYLVVDLIENFIVKQIGSYNSFIVEKKERKKAKQLEEKEASKKYTICLSIDYIAEKGLSEATKASLNKYIFRKIKEELRSTIENLEINSSNVLIVSSNDFKQYDIVYDSILIELARIEKMTKRKYEIEFIPNITTDAVSGDETFETIKSNHFEIKGYNLENMSLATSEFIEKYQSANNEKCKVIPIGRYLTRNSCKEAHELNIVQRDLNDKLENLA